MIIFSIEIYITRKVTLLFNVNYATIRGLKGHHHGICILRRNAFYFVHDIEKHGQQFHENSNS